MIILLYGEDTYRSRKKLREIIDAYRNKAKALLNFYRFDCEETPLEEIKRACESNSLFNGKKLVVLERLTCDEEKFSSLHTLLSLWKSDKEKVLVLWEEALKKEQIKKTLTALADKHQEFGKLLGVQLKQWIKEEAKERGVLLSSEVTRILQGRGFDTWAVVNTLEQIAVGGIDAVSQGYMTGVSPTVFELGDLFFSKRQRATELFLSLCARGNDDFELFSYLLNHTRTLAVVKSYQEAREPLSPAHRIHPFVAQKTTALVRQISFGELQNTLFLMHEEDVRIKTGITKPRESFFRVAYR